MSQKVIRRLGDRLDHIFQWVELAEPYDTIWDLCCDHGRLGLHLHQRHVNTRVYLVDVVAKIMDKLAEDYSALNDGRLHFKTADVCELPIQAKTRTLVIIAGVGGQNIIAMLSAILAQLPVGDKLEFMLSPNSHLYELRHFLQTKSFSVIDEAFVVDKDFCHEHLWLSVTRGHIEPAQTLQHKPVTAIGDDLWLAMTDEKRVYINKLLGHYQRLVDYQDSTLAQAALNAYGCLL